MASYFMMCGFSSLSYSFEMTVYKKPVIYWVYISIGRAVRGFVDSNPNMVLLIFLRTKTRETVGHSTSGPN